jgi:5'-3' exonuclease
MKNILVLDMMNILYRAFMVIDDSDDVISSRLALHKTLVTTYQYFKQHKPHKIFMCFDRRSWRKDYTSSEDCVSKWDYKGTRRKDMTESQKRRFVTFMEHTTMFEDLMREHTSIVSLGIEGLEADDLVAGIIQLIHDSDVTDLKQYVDFKINVISTDKDFIQTIRYPNVSLVDPFSQKERTLDEWGGDPDLFLFEKCLRGDSGDNVMSAYPRIRKTRIIKAYNDPFERANVMQTVVKNKEGKEFKVGDIFKENQLLVDLRYQPEDIRKKMNAHILEVHSKPGKYSYFDFLKFCKKNELKKIFESAEQYNSMFCL